MRKQEVALSIDAAQIAHAQTLDFILIGHSCGGKCETLLLQEIVMPQSTEICYRKVIRKVLTQMDELGVKINAIVSDGFASQTACVNDENPKCIQRNDGVPRMVKNIRWVYCRCHLVTLTVGRRLKDSSDALHYHLVIREMAT